MTTDGDARQQARLGLFLTVSLLLHAVAVPFMQTATTSDGHSGDGLQVTLVGAVRENPGGATASDRAPARSDDAPTRQRTTERRREPQVEATTTVDPSAEPTTPTSVRHRKPETTAPPAAQIARTEPAPPADGPTPRTTTTAHVESGETKPGTAPASVVARAEPAPAAAEPTPEPATAARVEDTEPGTGTPPATVVAVTEAAPAPDEPPPARTEPTPVPTTTARIANPEPETSTPPTTVVARTEPASSPAEPTATMRVEDPEPDASTPPTTVVARTEPASSPAEPTTSARVEVPAPETIQPPTREQSQTAASDSETPEPMQIPATATMATATAPGTLAGVAGDTAGGLGAGGERTLLALLHHAIDNRKRYPKLARRQRREGSATVLFRLHPDGALDRLQLAASSGFDLLDRAALRAVADVAPFAPATRYLTRDKQFSVEVEFRLF